MQLGSCGSGIKTRAPVSRKKRSTRSSGIKQADWFPKKAWHSRFGNQTGRPVPPKKLNTRGSGIKSTYQFPKKRSTRGSGIKRADRFPKKAKHSQFGSQTGLLVLEKSEALAVRESNWRTGSQKRQDACGSGIKQADRFPKKAKHSQFGNQAGLCSLLTKRYVPLHLF